MENCYINAINSDKIDRKSMLDTIYKRYDQYRMNAEGNDAVHFE